MDEVYMASSDPKHAWVYRFLARVANTLPAGLVAACTQPLGPVVLARTLPYLRTARIVELSEAMPPDFIADISIAMDPSLYPRVVPALPFQTVLETARPLIAKEAYQTTAEFASLLPRPHLKQLVIQLNDLTGVAHISGHLDPTKSAEVLSAFSLKLGAEVIEEVLRQGYRQRVAETGPLLSEQRLSGLREYLSEDAWQTLNEQVKPSSTSH